LYSNNSGILYQDPQILVALKAPKLHHDETPFQALGWKPLHRLDFETSGCLAFSREDCWEKLHTVFKRDDLDNKTVRKTYLVGAQRAFPGWDSSTLIQGWIESRYRSSKKVRFVLDSLPASRGIRTRVPALHRVEGPLLESDPRSVFARKSLGFLGQVCEVELISGARHQIRAFFASLDSPLCGDPLYTSANSKTLSQGSLELHAWKLEFLNPLTDSWIRVEADRRVP
jgi:23S rRNA-/tRNA-specific pseudouridylate synthase